MNPVNDEDGWRELAALHALGALEGEEAARFEQHLAACARCREDVAALSAVVEDLAEETPPAGLWDKVRSRVQDPARAQTWKRWAPAGPAAEGMAYVGAEDGPWEETGIAGIRARRLFVDIPNDRVTMLIRMEAGTRYPSHRHAGPEECFVLAGDIAVGDDLVMHAGDYQRAEAGSAHPVQSTRSGCTLLIVSSLHDELIAA